MGTTTYSGPIRSKNGFTTISTADATGTETTLWTSPAALTTGPGTGITTGTGTIAKTSISRAGSIITTQIVIDLTGLNSSAAADDIIGLNGTALPCHIGQITTAECGTILGGTITCLELPAGGTVDVDLYAATEATGVEDQAVSALTETILCNSGNHTLGGVKPLTAFPTTGQYLYLVNGTLTDATYTAGVLVIELVGIAA